MKNKYKIIPILLVLIAFGCQTEETDTSISDENNVVVEQIDASYGFKVKVVNDVLSFETREDFDKALEHLVSLGDENFEAWEKEMSFTSMRSVFSESELEEIGINDNLLAVFLNPEGLISFGENTFKTDYISNEVIMISNESFSSKSSFTSSKSKRVFQADDDVFGMLDGSVSESDNLSARRRGCPGNRGQYANNNVYIGGDKYEIKAQYQRFWPYYSLQAKIKRADGVAAVEETRIGLETLYPTFFKKKKRRASCDRRHGQSTGGFGRSYNIRVYYSSRQLQAYDFYVHFWGSNSRGQLDTTLRPRCSSC